MAVTTGKQYAVGFRSARVYALDSRGLIDAVDHLPYEGIQVPSVKALEMTIPDVRRIVHVGDDRINAQDTLPRIEASSGVMRVGRNDYDLYAMITGTKVRTVGEMAKIGYATDKQGAEADIGMLAFQQSLDSAARTRRYHAYAFAILKAILAPGSMDENPAEYSYSLVPNTSTKSLWGEQYTELADGYIESEFDDWMTVSYPHIVAWVQDGVVAKFLFHADRPATSVDKIHGVWIATTAQNYTTEDATATLALDGVTPTALPAAGTLIVCAYEYAP